MTTVTNDDDPVGVADALGLPTKERPWGRETPGDWHHRVLKPFSGQSLAKGRNGWFKLAEAQWWDVASSGERDTPIHLAFRSRRTGDADPIMFQLTRDDANALRVFLDTALRGDQYRSDRP